MHFIPVLHVKNKISDGKIGIAGIDCGLYISKVVLISLLFVLRNPILFAKILKL